METVKEVTSFLQAAKNIPVIDARSEGEYATGHIPGSVNVPLLDNQQRRIIGTIYKQQGRQAAVQKGFELIGPLFHQKFKQLARLASDRQLLIYCQRGGMRSGILAWMMQLAEYKVFTLRGGYKAYRQWVLQVLQQPFQWIILGGKTGTGKTKCLHYLQQAGEQIIDFEGLACHKGSAFGHIGQPPQPTQEHFENLIAMQLWQMNPKQKIWAENESRMIGKLKIPDAIFEQIRKAPILCLQVEESMRQQRLLEEYGTLPINELAAATKKLEKKLGSLHTQQALEALKNGYLSAWLKILLLYYDKTYQHELAKRPSPCLSVPFDWHNIQESIHRLCFQANQLWNNALPSSAPVLDVVAKSI